MITKSSFAYLNCFSIDSLITLTLSTSLVYYIFLDDLPIGLDSIR